MQPRPNRPLSLTSFEWWCVVLSSVALLLIGNAKLFLERYGLLSSSHAVGAQLSGRFTSGLSVLDRFSITPGLVTMAVWGCVGLLIFSLTQAILRASAAVTYQRELGSNRFVHPTNFNRRTYWRHVCKHAAASFGLLSLLIITLVFYAFFVIPVSFYYTQTFLFDISLAHLRSVGFGLFTILIGTTMLYCAAKLVRWQHRQAAT